MKCSFLTISLLAAVGAVFGASAHATSFAFVRNLDTGYIPGFPKMSKDKKRQKNWKQNRKRVQELSKRGVSRPVGRGR